MLKVPLFALAFGMALIILEDNLVLYLCMFLVGLTKGPKMKHCKLEGNDIRQLDNIQVFKQRT